MVFTPVTVVAYGCTVMEISGIPLSSSSHVFLSLLAQGRAALIPSMAKDFSQIKRRHRNIF
jgi:hypothetical protein